MHCQVNFFTINLVVLIPQNDDLFSSCRNVIFEEGKEVFENFQTTSLCALVDYSNGAFWKI